MRLTLSVPGESAAGAAIHTATGIGVTPSFLSTIGVPVLHGRSFTEGDQAATAPVVIVSAFTARTLFGATDVIGRQLVVQGRSPASTIVGVTRDTDVGMILGEARLFVYLPLAQTAEPFRTIVARSPGGTPFAVRGLRSMLRRADPELAAESIGGGRAVLSGPFVFLRAAGLAALALGATTLLLAMAGLFGVQSQMVRLRTREIGVRMSLGATAGRIRRMVLQDGARPVLEGLSIGLFIGVTGRAVVRRYLEIDSSVIDPWMLVIVPVPLILAGVCACYLPARRAAAVDPNVALRHL